MKKNKLFYVLFFFLFFSLQSKVLLWDFGGIVFNPYKLGVAREIGLHNFISYFLVDHKNPNIQKEIFDFLDMIMPWPEKKYALAGTGEDIPLPLIMCHWQAGTITGSKIIKIAKQYIRRYKNMGYFRSERERKLFERTIEKMFNPNVLAENVYPVKRGVELLRECASAKNDDGTKKNINIGFSNWDPISFDKFFENNEEVFKYFDHVIISGHIGMIKPHRKAFRYVLEKYNLDPADCILIDDQEINAVGAKNCGMKSIIMKNWDFKSLRSSLETAKVF